MSGHEVMLTYEWLSSTLKADSALTSIATGGIWRGSAPPETTTPYVVMNMQAGRDITTMNGVRIYDNLLFQVKAIGPATITDELLAAANEIDRLLGRTSGVPFTADGFGLILACYRDSPVQIDSLVNGELWTDIGGLYRIYIEHTS